MPRLPIPARLGLLALLVLATVAARSTWAAQHTADHAAPAPSATSKVNAASETPAEKQEAKANLTGAKSEPGHETTADVEGKQPDIMEVQSPLAIYTLVVFGLVLLILTRFAWRPLINALHEREAHLEQVLVDSERARNEAEAIAARHRKQLEAAADEVRSLIEQARKEGQAAADSILRQAQAEAEASRDRAEREIEGARDQALMEIWSKTADLAVSVAGRVLEKELGESDHRRLVEAALGELPSNGQAGAKV